MLRVDKIDKNADPDARKVGFRFAELFYMRPRLGATKHSANRDGDDISQVVELLTVYPWIRKGSKMLLDGKRVGIAHGSSP